jgi:predicted flap endonuclease-1-like 5' DNA nuclease
MQAVQESAPVSPPAPVAPVVEESVAPAPAREAPRDDLTLIHGIGQATQRRLNDAGIWTFAQLAAADEEQLRESIGQVGRIAKVDEWITLAREMTG